MSSKNVVYFPQVIWELFREHSKTFRDCSAGSAIICKLDAATKFQPQADTKVISSDHDSLSSASIVTMRPSKRWRVGGDRLMLHLLVGCWVTKTKERRDLFWSDYSLMSWVSYVFGRFWCMSGGSGGWRLTVDVGDGLGLSSDKWWAGMQRVTVMGDGLGICYMTNRWVKGDGWWVCRVENFLFVCLSRAGKTVTLLYLIDVGM